MHCLHRAGSSTYASVTCSATAAAHSVQSQEISQAGDTELIIFTILYRRKEKKKELHSTEAKFAHTEVVP